MQSLIMKLSFIKVAEYCRLQLFNAKPCSFSANLTGCPSGPVLEFQKNIFKCKSILCLLDFQGEAVCLCVCFFSLFQAVCKFAENFGKLLRFFFEKD